MAVMGLVAAVAILGGTLSQTMNQFTIYVNENQILKEENARLQEQIEELKNNIQAPVKQEKTVTKSEAESLLVEKLEEARPSADDARVLAQGTNSAVFVEQNLVIKNHEDFLQLWKKLQRDEPLPSVNFDSEVVFAAFYGQQPTLCYSITIDTVELFQALDNTIDAVVNITKTSGDPQCLERPSQPYFVVEFPFVPDDVFFKDPSDLFSEAHLQH